MNNFLLGTTTCLVGVFIGYCIYYDYKRRMDPNYKKKVYERRMSKLLKLQRQQERAICESEESGRKERYFALQIKQAETFLRANDYTTAVACLMKALRVCRNPPLLIQSLQHSLPPKAYKMLVHLWREQPSGSSEGDAESEGSGYETVSFGTVDSLTFRDSSDESEEEVDVAKYVYRNPDDPDVYFIEKKFVDKYLAPNETAELEDSNDE